MGNQCGRHRGSGADLVQHVRPAATGRACGRASQGGPAWLMGWVVRRTGCCLARLLLHPVSSVSPSGACGYCPSWTVTRERLCLSGPQSFCPFLSTSLLSPQTEGTWESRQHQPEGGWVQDLCSLRLSIFQGSSRLRFPPEIEVKSCPLTPSWWLCTCPQQADPEHSAEGAVGSEGLAARLTGGGGHLASRFSPIRHSKYHSGISVLLVRFPSEVARGFKLQRFSESPFFPEWLNGLKKGNNVSQLTCLSNSLHSVPST